MAAESSSHPIRSVLLRVAILWLGVNAISMFYLDGSLSLFTLDNLGKRSVAVLFRSAAEFTEPDKLDIADLAESHGLSPKSIEGFLYTRSRLQPDLFNRFGQMGICALDPIGLMRTQLWQPYAPHHAADACLRTLQSLRGESLSERMEMFALLIDGSNQLEAEQFADRVLNYSFVKQAGSGSKSIRPKVNQRPPLTDSPTTDLQAEELPIIGPDDDIVEPLAEDPEHWPQDSQPEQTILQ